MPGVARPRSCAFLWLFDNRIGIAAGANGSKDALAHTTAANNNDWDVMIGPNKTARLVLTKPGEVDYYCKFHPNMKGRVAVAN